MSSDKYIHSDVEDKIYSYWEKNELFKPRENSKKFSIVIPPPNVTGSLHMGHALNNSIQDLLVRYHRMNNYETLWQPGTDHAGIATQALVERKLTSEKIDKNEIGREKFIEKVWEWKEQYGDIIINQLKKLGCSCDWSRNAFTMDENLSKSVIKVFVDLYNKGLIYKDKKLVNWDTVLKTAISDLEVDQREVNSKIYYIKYPIDGTGEFITIATTRPETMLGDTAIAVNPKDERFTSFVGKTVTIPIVGRKINIIEDDYADPEQGTGALKITPAHDFNDYDVGKRNKLEIINIFEKNGTINKNNIVYKSRKGAVGPRTKGQVSFLENVMQNDIAFGIGPAGTGKTFLSMAFALASLEESAVDRIILCRPAVEAGENLGFLPGDLKEKVDPYLSPLYDALDALLPKKKLGALIENKNIEIVPLAYMRGRTLDNAFIILDEAQNSTAMQMKMFLTRLGMGSKAIINGDTTQIDLAGNKLSGLIQAKKILQDVGGIGFTYFDDSDIVRHPLVKKIIVAYDENDKKNGD